MTEALNRLEHLLVMLRRWQPQIEEALHHGRNAHSFDDIVGLIMANRVMFFCYDKCFVVMEKIEYPQFSVFHCFLAGGEMQAVLDAQADMENVGRQLGCAYLSFAGRRGWERMLASRGWAHVATTMYCPIKEIHNERRQRRAADANGEAARCH